MSSISSRLRLFLVAGLLTAVVLLTGLSFPGQVGAFQSTDPTATITPTFLPGESLVESGETGSLILGAAVILLIIIAGVAIQRILVKKES